MNVNSPSASTVSASFLPGRTALGIAALLLVIHAGGGRQVWRPKSCPGLSPSAACLRFDPNTATRDELMLLPGIGPALGDRIVAYREAAGRHPAYRSADDLDSVSGIGPATVEKLRPHLRFEPRLPNLPEPAP